MVRYLGGKGWAYYWSFGSFKYLYYGLENENTTIAK